MTRTSRQISPGPAATLAFIIYAHKMYAQRIRSCIIIIAALRSRHEQRKSRNGLKIVFFCFRNARAREK